VNHYSFINLRQQRVALENLFSHIAVTDFFFLAVDNSAPRQRALGKRGLE